MIPFGIEIQLDVAGSVAMGRIVVGPFSERFEAALDYWSPADYVKHWRHAEARLETGEGDALFFTSLTDPQGAHFFRCWIAWREGEEVMFQEVVLFAEQLPEPLDLEAPWRHVPARTTVSEDGDPISEWSLHWPVGLKASL